MKVCVLISSYNGENYIEEQLQSIINQEGVEADILVRDDGSTDRTADILNAWQDEGKLKWYKGVNKGFALSFMDLLIHAKGYDYYAFCDQDDIWLPEKLGKAVAMLEAEDSDIKLYCSNTYLYKDGEIIGQLHDSIPMFDKYTCLLRSITPGCTMVFNEHFRKLAASAPPKKIIAHDLWIYQIAMMTGKVIYDSTPSMLYRQHENNTIGQDSSLVLKKWKKRITFITIPEKRHEREDQVKELMRCHSSSMSEESLSIARIVAGYRKSFKNRFNFIRDKRFTMGNATRDFYLKLRILFSLF